MQQRNPLYAALIWLIPSVGLLVWWFTWYLPTKREMNQKYNAGIVTGWIVLVPFIGFLYFHWSYAGGAAKVHGKYSQGLGFILMLFILPVGAYLQQAAFNEAAQRGGAALQRAA